MKILHILDHSLPLHSGYTFRSQNIFREQRKMGFDPVIVTSPKHEESWKGPYVEKEEINGFTYYRTGPIKKFPIPVTSELWLMLELARRIIQVAKIERPDIIHAHSPALNGFPALWAGKKLGLPVVYEIRAFWEDAAVDHGTCKEGSLRYNMTKYAETMVCRRADHITILCNGLKNDLISRNIPADKITVIFNGVNPDDFKPCPPDPEYKEKWNPSGKKIIGFIGSFYRYEGLDLLIRSFADVIKKIPDTLLLLIGGGEVMNELKDLTTELQIEQKVIMPGRIPHERVPGSYALIDILVYPRYSMRLTDLVTPLKPLEAMAMSKALIASNVGGHKELIAHNKTGLLFNAGDQKSLTKQITNLMTNSRHQKDLQREGNSWVVTHHPWNKTTQAYQDIYDRLLPKNTSQSN